MLLVWCLYWEHTSQLVLVFLLLTLNKNEMTKTVTQWANGLLITFKMFPRYCPRLPHTG